MWAKFVSNSRKWKKAHRKFQINTLNRDFARTLISNTKNTEKEEKTANSTWEIYCTRQIGCEKQYDGRAACKAEAESERRTFKKKSSLTIFGRRARYVHWLRIALFYMCVRLFYCFDSCVCALYMCVFAVYSCHIDCLQASPDPSTEMFKLVNTHTHTHRLRVCVLFSRPIFAVQP